MKDFKPQELVKFVVKGGLTYTDDGFAMGSTIPGSYDCLKIYEKIDLERFPSCNDFFGPSSTLYHDDIVIIVRLVGRPENISNDPRWFKYDVYEIVTPSGAMRQVFKQNLRGLQD